MKHRIGDARVHIRAYRGGTGWRPCALVVAVLTSLPILATAQLTPVVLDNDPARAG